MFKSKRRKLALALVATAVVSMLVACGGGADAPPPGLPGTTIPRPTDTRPDQVTVTEIHLPATVTAP